MVKMYGLNNSDVANTVSTYQLEFFAIHMFQYSLRRAILRVSLSHTPTGTRGAEMSHHERFKAQLAHALPKTGIEAEQKFRGRRRYRIAIAYEERAPPKNGERR